MAKLTYITQETQEDSQFAVICLHGLGASGQDLAHLLPLLKLEHVPIRFIFPQAPTQAITINNGYEMPAWYDIHSLDFDVLNRQDQQGLLRSEQLIIDLIEQQIKLGIPSHHIFILGFSQGGALALFTGLRFQQTLAGIVGLSTYLPLHHLLLESLNDANTNTPILLAHGNSDSIVEAKWGLHSKQILDRHGYAVDWFSYDMDHSICAEEIADISRWLETTIRKNHKHT